MKPEKMRERMKARKELRAMMQDLAEWKAAGLPPREPMTQAEAQRRLDLYRHIDAMLLGNQDV